MRRSLMSQAGEAPARTMEACNNLRPPFSGKQPTGAKRRATGSEATVA